MTSTQLTVRELGLYISHPCSPEETDRPFPEPGVFIVNDKGKAQVIDVSNASFGRPELEMVLHGLEYIRNPEENYPIRGHTHKCLGAITTESSLVDSVTVGRGLYVGRRS